MDTSSVFFKAVRPQGRCRLRNRVGLEKPLSSTSGPSPRTGSSATASRNCVWVFGGLAQVEEEQDDDDDMGHCVRRLKPTNELWSFDVTLMLWSWHGCEVRALFKEALGAVLGCS